MLCTILQSERDRISMVKAFQTVQAKRGLFIGLGLMVFQQFTGCNAVIFYATTIFNVNANINVLWSLIVQQHECTTNVIHCVQGTYT